MANISIELSTQLSPEKRAKLEEAFQTKEGKKEESLLNYREIQSKQEG